MTRKRLLYSAASLVLALVIGFLAAGIASDAGREGVVAGATTAVAFQLLVFWVFTGIFADRPVVAFGLAALSRLLLVVVMALVVLPRSGWAVAPTLLTLVSVLFATTLLEPVFLRPMHGTGTDDR